jgi:hypothetical protein
MMESHAGFQVPHERTLDLSRARCESRVPRAVPLVSALFGLQVSALLRLREFASMPASAHLSAVRDSGTANSSRPAG